jgi:hypothetical protein
MSQADGYAEEYGRGYGQGSGWSGYVQSSYGQEDYPSRS